MSGKQQIIYYTNELEDEFSKAQITAKKIDENYSYLGGIGRKLLRTVFYYAIARPLGYLFVKIKFGHRIVNKEILKEVKGKGYFMYGNHTNIVGDPFFPQYADVNRSMYMIVHPNNISMPVLGPFVPALGAIPLPDTMDAARNFNNAVKKLAGGKNCIVIYPEAHIWPYYTKIRPFKNTSFGYPLQCKAPVYCFTNTYQKRRFFKTPRVVTYIDGPFKADESLSKAEQKEQLRNMVYGAMIERSKNNNVELIRYIKKDLDE